MREELLIMQTIHQELQFRMVKRTVRWLMFIAIIYAVFSGIAHAGEVDKRSFFDKNGSFAGSSVSREKDTSFSDRNGSFAGSAIRNKDGSSSFYDKNGHFTGSSTSTRQPR